VSEERKCETCRYWRVRPGILVGEAEEGDCRFNPPRVIQWAGDGPDGGASGDSMWASSRPDDVCSEWVERNEAERAQIASDREAIRLKDEEFRAKYPQTTVEGPADDQG